MSDLMNMTREECAELIALLEREQGRLQLGFHRPSTKRAGPTDQGRQEILKRLLWKAKAGATTPETLNPAELIEYRLAGYC